MDVHFDCTRCTQCCRRTKIPLTVHESVEWLADGNEVQIICEASPWRTDGAPPDPKSARLERRSFEAQSGSIPIRVVVLLVANIPGDCPNLNRDSSCGVYDRRPLVCQIYPAEMNPFVTFDPSKKACPVEAWASQHPLLMRNGKLMKPETERNIERWRAAETLDVAAKRRLCRELSISDAAVAEEGFLVFTPSRQVMLETLHAAIHESAPRTDGSGPLSSWALVTNRSATAHALAQSGALVRASPTAAGLPCEYIGLKTASAPA